MPVLLKKYKINILNKSQSPIIPSFLQLFSAAADILWKIGENARIIQDFVQLGSKAKNAATEARDAEAVLGDIPDEFLDPIQVNLLFPFISIYEICHLKYFQDSKDLSHSLANKWFLIVIILICCLLLQYTLMKDPVILPSSRISIDRAVIQRHLLSDSVCVSSHSLF